MSNVVVDYSSVINLIREEFEIIRRNSDKFSGVKLVVEDERLLAKEKDRSPDTIYCQVKFGAASTNFGQAVLPFSLEIIGINQDIELTQDFLNEFVNTYNRVSLGNFTQFYLTPVVSQNNIPIYEGYRSMFIISATFVIANDLLGLTELKYKSGTSQETVGVIAYNDSSEANLNPQPYPDKGGRTKSYGSFMTFAFTITTYPDKTKQLIKDLFAWKFDKTHSHQNDTFIFTGVFGEIADGMGFDEWEFKCKSCDFTYKIGETPAITATFTI